MKILKMTLVSVLLAALCAACSSAKTEELEAELAASQERIAVLEEELKDRSDGLEAANETIVKLNDEVSELKAKYEPPKEADNTSANDKGNLRLYDVGFYEGYIWLELRGKLENNTGGDINNLTIRLYIYDEDGVRLGDNNIADYFSTIKNGEAILISCLVNDIPILDYRDKLLSQSLTYRIEFENFSYVGENKGAKTIQLLLDDFDREGTVIMK